MRWAIMLVLIGCSHAQAFCTLGSDGNYYTDEDPFIDAANHDFRLKPGSCAIDHAATLPEVTEDFIGTPRPQGVRSDIGAYEFIDPPLGPPEQLRKEPT